MVPDLQPLNLKGYVMTVTTYQDLLETEHTAIMEHCEAVTRLRHNPANRYGRPIKDLMVEYEAQLAATSINMINFNSTPWS